MWLDQFEFAGFYVAKEKGFYKKFNLDVELKKYDVSLDVTKEVIEKRADFGTSSSSLISDKSAGKDIFLLGSIFQSSPLVLLALKDSNIKSIQDIKGKTVMLTKEQKRFATLQSMLVSKGVMLDDINIIEHSFDVNDLINKKADLMLAYTTNEPYILKEKGYESKIFHPKAYGFDFYEELIFTTKEYTQKNPEIVKNFYKATIDGWNYAFNNIEEVAKLIFEKYNPQKKTLESLIFEANEMKKLVFDRHGKIGTIDEDRVNLIVNTYRVMGLIDDEFNSKDIIYKKHLKNTLFLDKDEKDFLLKKDAITMCIDPNWMPFESIKDGKHIGIAADYISLIEDKIKTRIELVPTKSWSESISFAKKRKCDILSLAMTTPEREKYLNFTTPYLNTPLVVASKIDAPYIDNITQIKDKKLAVIKDYAYGELLKIRFPNIKFIDVKNVSEGLKKVENGEIFGFIETLHTLGYQIQKNYIGQLKITGKFEEKWDLSVAVRNDEPILIDILNKAINDISNDEKQKILNKWISINFQKSVDSSYLIKIIIGVSILFLLIFLVYRQYLLKKLNLELNKKVEEEIEKNEEKNKVLIQQSRMASMGEMLENIAHQWRQPLSNISVSASGILLKKDLNLLNDEELETSINHILKATNYLSHTIDDFRNFINNKKVLKNTNSQKIINKSLDLIFDENIRKDIMIIKSIEDFDFLSLENEIIQVLMNIFSNSKDAFSIGFLEKEKYIFINLYKKDNSVVFEIKDNAGGIDGSIISKIFEPYFTTKHKYKGTGIGLYMSKLLVEKHLNGSIKVGNEDYNYFKKRYKGAKFTITIPLD